MSNQQKLKLAVFVSGNGSNLQSIIDACRIDNFPAEIGLVIANKTESFGLVRAAQAGIPTRIVSHKDFPTRELFEEQLLLTLRDFEIDLICLAGFMRVLTPHFIAPWLGRLINIHPSLLPKYKGLHTHERAITAGDKEAGCTTHFVSAEVDEGEVILQRSVPIFQNDTPDLLAKRVLKEEHILYPETIKLMAHKLLVTS